jgi:hypothetical protein
VEFAQRDAAAAAVAAAFSAAVLDGGAARTPLSGATPLRSRARASAGSSPAAAAAAGQPATDAGLLTGPYFLPAGNPHCSS